MDILFINKNRENIFTDEVGEHQAKKQLSSGLNNSVNFINDELNKNEIKSAHAHAIDSNYIDKLVHTYNPKIVIIEGLWAMPAKFLELCRLHPNIKWIIRFHSDLPFIASEGIFSLWFFQYLNIKNMWVGVNSTKMYSSLKHIVPQNKLLYLPNYYPIDDYNELPKLFNFNRNYINIGCFGAIRNLKNQFLQAFAAIEFAEKRGLSLNFHMNMTRIEDNSNSVEKNIRHLFKHNKKHNLISHTWMDHDKFLDVVANMDMGLQVSFAETFNIVAADCVNRNVPSIVSNEIYWADDRFKVHPTDYELLIERMNFIWDNKSDEMIYVANKNALKKYCASVIPTWKEEISKM